jgi:hypothetical protein
MTENRHTIDYYFDNKIRVDFCKLCSAEGDKLLENCPQNIEPAKKYVDEKKIIDDFENYY